MAVNHGDSSVLAFVDGHSKVRRWGDAYTRQRVTKLSRDTLKYGAYDIEYPPVDQTRDINYMADGWAYRY